MLCVEITREKRAGVSNMGRRGSKRRGDYMSPPKAFHILCAGYVPPFGLNQRGGTPSLKTVTDSSQLALQ